MPHYLKLFSALLLCVSTVGLVGCDKGYTPNPEDDIALFQPFIDANINKKSDDPYISSTAKPGDKLYDTLVNIQHGRHDVAIKELEPLVEQGDAEAQFWMAKMIYRSSVKNIRPALNLYKKSAEQNNPFAYMMMSPGLVSSGCDAYFGERNCTMDNLGKAVELFKQRAQQGDLRAQYFLLGILKPDGSYVEDGTYAQKFHLTESAETRQQYLKDVIRFAEHHYYQPLMDYINTILIWDSNLRGYKKISPQKTEMIESLLTIAANNNYIPAIDLLITLNRDKLEQDSYLYNKLYKLAGTSYLSSRFYDFEESYTRKELSCYALMFKEMTGNSKFFIRFDRRPSTDELNSFNCNVDEKLKKLTPMVYIDGFTSRNKWVD